MGMAKKMKIDSLKSDEIKSDGLQNCVTQIGISGKDKKAATTFAVSIKSQTELDGLYQSNDIAKKMVNLLPFDMTREGIIFTGSEQKFKDFIQKEFNRLALEDQCTEAMMMARHYGGACLYFFFDDGMNQNEPIDVKKIKGIKFVRAFDRYEIFGEDICTDVFQPNFRMPTYYSVSSASNTGLKIHYTRMIRFDGARLPWSVFKINNYWHDSVLSAAWDPIVNYDGALSITRTMMEDFRTKIIKLKGLLELLQAGKVSLVTRRLELFDYQSSIMKAVILNEGDDFENKVVSFTSIPEVVQELKERMVGASEMPHTKLFGSGPSGGIGATGESEQGDWHEYVKTNQEDCYRPVLEQVIEWMKAYGKMENMDSNFEFKPIEIESKKERAEIYKLVAEADKIYMELGALGEDEVADSRWGSGEYSIETTIDAKTRKTIKNAKPDQSTGQNKKGY